MRRLLPKSVLAAAAVACVTLPLGGCAAEVHGAPPAAPHPAAPAPEAPPALPERAPFEGLDARLRQAAAQASDAGATVEVVVLDRTTGQVVANGGDAPFPVASVVKLFIADDLLMREADLSSADRASLDAMLRSSDDGAAQQFWDRGGQTDIISRIVDRYGLSGTIPPYRDGKWDVTQSTARDLVRYYDMLLNGSGGLPPEKAELILDNLARFTPTGLDGYPQRFGIPDGLPGDTVAVKQGWFCCWNGGNQLHVSTGTVGADRRYVMAIGALQPTDEATARATVTQVVKTMFPGGRI